MALSLPTRLKIGFLTCLIFSACSSDLPAERHSHYTFPAHDVFQNLPTGPDQGRPYEVLGWVRAKSEYPTMEQAPNNPALCYNYYNKAARSLLKESKKVKGDAVIQVRSIVMFMDGTFEEKVTPECADDGQQGEILLRGVAIRYLPMPSPTPTPALVPRPSPHANLIPAPKAHPAPTP